MLQVHRHCGTCGGNPGASMILPIGRLRQITV
jgi:hypothetical protein